MARNPKEESTKVFGGTSVVPGTYFIIDSIITDEVLTVPGQADTHYDALQVVLAYDQNGARGAEVEATLVLNGCWRPRRGSDDKRYQASGSFFTELLKACQGKGFVETRNHIRNAYNNRRITVDYIEYPSQHGGFGRVPKVEFL